MSRGRTHPRDWSWCRWWSSAAFLSFDKLENVPWPKRAAGALFRPQGDASPKKQGKGRSRTGARKGPGLHKARAAEDGEGGRAAARRRSLTAHGDVPLKVKTVSATRDD